MPPTSSARRAAGLPGRPGKKRLVEPEHRSIRQPNTPVRRPGLLVVLALALTSLAMGPVHAHTPDWPDRAWPKHGGLVQTAGDVRVELVAKPERLDIYLRDPGNQSVVDEVVSGEILIWSDDGSKDIPLSREGTHLTAAASPPATAPFRVIVELQIREKAPLKLLFGPMTLSEQETGH